MEADSYNKQRFTYPICNLYYDTDDNHLIRTSLSKPLYKEKLRLRSYGRQELTSKVYIEIKKKFRGTVNKRRSAIRLIDAYGFVESGELPELQPCMNAQVLREIEYLLSQRELKPKVWLSYERRAFFSSGNSDLRVSFDTNILTRRGDLRLESDIYGEALLPRDTWLMEIKSASNFPLWLSRLLSEHGIFPVSFSKYGTEYAQTLTVPPRERKTKQSEGLTCLIPLSAR
ncbi:molecular chaperone [Clostridia bacterium]|nr:molecular chaperone [Clostridia bacterium]